MAFDATCLEWNREQMLSHPHNCSFYDAGPDYPKYIKNMDDWAQFECDLWQYLAHKQGSDCCSLVYFIRGYRDGDYGKYDLISTVDILHEACECWSDNVRVL